MTTRYAFGFRWMSDAELDRVQDRWLAAKRRGQSRRAQIPLDRLKSYQRCFGWKVRSIMAAMERGAEFRPIVVAEHGDMFEIVDGCHRATACLALGRKSIEAIVWE